MVRGHLEGPLDRLRPAREALAGDVVEEVQAHLPDPGGASREDGLADVAGAVTAPQRPEVRVVQALGAQREAGDAGAGEPGEVAPVVGPGVRLERHLGPLRQAEPGAHAVDELRDRVGGEKRRRAPADVERGEGRAPRIARRARSAASSAAARRSISQSSATRNAPTRLRGPTARAPATTTKSQYGQSERQNGTWT